MSDEVIVCVECGRTFTWSYGEQRYYKEHGLDRPKRCPACRQQRKAEVRSGVHGWSLLATEVAESPAQRQPKVEGISRAERPRWVVRPAFRFGAVALAAAIVLAAVLALGFALDGLLSWLIGISVVTLLAYAYDKAVAGSERTRVPVKVLLGLALVGGTIGAWAGMQLFHHKTAKGSFQLKFWGIVAAQVVLVLVYYVFIQR